MKMQTPFVGSVKSTKKLLPCKSFLIELQCVFWLLFLQLEV